MLAPIFTASIQFKMKGLLQKFNRRQIIIHFIATWFFMYAFQVLSFLHNLRLFLLIKSSIVNNQLDTTAISSKFSASAINSYYFWTSTANTIGLFVAFIFSLILSVRRKWFFGNSLLVVLIAYTLGYAGWLGWEWLGKLFWVPGMMFKDPVYQYVINGFVLLVFGCSCFLLPPINQYIDIPNKEKEGTVSENTE